tara:strand:+ start:3260 stop:5131 length:1872 start_codon:yes stop_codon:yes gene_type:complete
MGASLALASGLQCAAPASKQPNIVLFLVDDLGWMDTTVYGSRYYETPNVERLARLSLRFTNAYAASPLCTATRASILTGKYPGRLHVTGASGNLPVAPGPLMPERAPPHMEWLLPRCKGRLDRDEYTLARALKDAGYRTGFVGKWHLGHDENDWPEHHGFDVNVGGGRWPGPPSYFSPYRISNLSDGPDGEYLADRLTDEALSFVESSVGTPFFLNFWQYAVHAPYQGKEQYRRHFQEKADPRDAQHNAVMGAMIKSMDESLGRVLDTLETLGIMDNTIIIFSSDNGGNMYDRTAPNGENYGPWAPKGLAPTNNAPLRGGKGSVYEGGIRVPTIVYWPGVTIPNSVSEEVISTIDYYPTLLDMVGSSKPEAQVFDGRSIVPALMASQLDRSAMFGHFPHSVPAVPSRPASWVREHDWKLIRFYGTDEEFPNRLELYNLKEDIGEVDNLASKHPELARRLEAMLDKHLLETGAYVPTQNPDYDYQPGAVPDIFGWHHSSSCWLKRGANLMQINSIGGDPFIYNEQIPALVGGLAVRFRMRSNSSGKGQFFWATKRGPRFGAKRRLSFTPIHDNEWHEYWVPFKTASALKSIRLDPATAPGQMDIEWIRVEEKGDTVIEWRFPDL